MPPQQKYGPRYTKNDEFEKKKVDAGQKRQERKPASAAARGNLKAEFLAMMKDLEQSYKRALSHL